MNEKDLLVSQRSKSRKKQSKIFPSIEESRPRVDSLFGPLLRAIERVSEQNSSYGGMISSVKRRIIILEGLKVTSTLRQDTVSHQLCSKHRWVWKHKGSKAMVEGTYPTQWKKAKLALIEEKYKPLHLPSSYQH